MKSHFHWLISFNPKRPSERNIEAVFLIMCETGQGQKRWGNREEKKESEQPAECFNSFTFRGRKKKTGLQQPVSGTHGERKNGRHFFLFLPIFIGTGRAVTLGDPLFLLLEPPAAAAAAAPALLLDLKKPPQPVLELPQPRPPPPLLLLPNWRISAGDMVPAGACVG